MSLQHTMFQRVFFPDWGENDRDESQEELTLQRVIRYKPKNIEKLQELSIVVFDFECTGLDQNEDRIVEIGAIKLEGMKAVGEFSTLVNPEIRMSDASIQITGITNEMVANEPVASQVIPDFLSFINGSLLVAHNADFDLGFLVRAAARLGYALDWATLCTLKLARNLLPDLESKSLDHLARHFDLQFESRHRSIGDVKVTCGVLEQMLKLPNSPGTSWGDFLPYAAVAKR